MSTYTHIIRTPLADEIAATRTARQLAELGRRIPTGAPEWDAYARQMELVWGHAAVRMDAGRFCGRVRGRRRPM